MSQGIINAVKFALADLPDDAVMAAAKARGFDNLTPEQARAAYNFNEAVELYTRQKNIATIYDPERFLPGGHQSPDKLNDIWDINSADSLYIENLKHTKEYQEAVRFGLGEASARRYERIQAIDPLKNFNITPQSASTQSNVAQTPAVTVAQVDNPVVAFEPPTTNQSIIASQESAPVNTISQNDMGSFSANDFEGATLNLPEAPAVNVAQSNEVLTSSPVAETAQAPIAEATHQTNQASDNTVDDLPSIQVLLPTIPDQILAPSSVASQNMSPPVVSSTIVQHLEPTPPTSVTAEAVQVNSNSPATEANRDLDQEIWETAVDNYTKSLDSVGVGAYEKKIGETFGVSPQNLEFFAKEVNPTNFDKSGKNMLGRSLNEVLSRHEKIDGAQVEPISRLLSNPVLDDASFNAYKTKYDENIKAGLNPIAAAAHNQPAMVNKPHSSFAAALESDKGSIAKILGSGAVGAGLGYGLYDNPEEGFIMGVAGGAMGVGVKKAVGAYSDNIQAGMMKGLLKDNYRPGNTPEALNENFTAVAKLNKEDLGFVDNYYKDTLTKNFGTASMGLQTRTMTLSGAALAGVAFTGNKKDKRRGFNANRGNRI